MGSLTYQLLIKRSAPICKRGDKLSLTVNVINPTREIASVMIEVPKYGISKKLPKVNKNVYAYAMSVPFFVPCGKYEAVIYALDIHGNKGPKEEVAYEII